MSLIKKPAQALKVLLILVLSFALCGFVLVGCGSSKDTEKSDQELMNEAVKSKDPFYVLIVGNDSREGTVNISNPNYSDGLGRSDTMMLCRVNPTDYSIGLITIPRDTAVPYDDGSVAKINEVYKNNGIDGLRSEVEKLTGVTIKYHLDMGFVDFENFIDGIGGLTANVPIDMELYDVVGGKKVNLSAGEQKLNGVEALVLARVRKLYDVDIESCRQIQDRQIVQRAITQVAKDPSTAMAMVDVLRKFADTDWDEAEMKALVKDFANHAEKITFISGTGPYKGDFMEQYNGLWLTERDEATWKKVISAVESGQDPTKVVALPEVRAAQH